MRKLSDYYKNSILQISNTTIIVLLTGLLLMESSCNRRNNSASVPVSVGKQVAKPDPLKNDTILNRTVGYVDGRKFTIQCNTGDLLFLRNERGDTLYRDSVYSDAQNFKDFDGDGYKDIVIEYVTNIPGIQDVLRYDHLHRTFKKIEGLQTFPASERLNGTKYYYSYQRKGCADMAWKSDLFYIENYKAIRIGNIYGDGCNEVESKNKIRISKVKNGAEILVNTRQLAVINHYKSGKWGFIADYWRRNYKKFE